MTGFISSYSIKSKIIISIFNNRNLIKLNHKYKSYIIYIIIGIIQFLLLTFWTFTQKGIETKERLIKDTSVFYEYQKCSNGNVYIFSLIFLVDYVLLLISIYIAYRGRNIPDEFNESKKVFVTSIATFGM
eukprot:jgi/Orpsp1_1/1192443/evm.model.d7180000093286.1